MKRIADSGLLKAVLDADDRHHAWAADEFSRHAPFHTCDAVLAEVAALLNAPAVVMQLVVNGDVVLDFDLQAEHGRVMELLSKYHDHPMDLADACIVRMAELEERVKVWTTDRRDFSAYRRHGRQTVPCEFPPED